MYLSDTNKGRTSTSQFAHQTISNEVERLQRILSVSSD